MCRFCKTEEGWGEERPENNSGNYRAYTYDNLGQLTSETRYSIAGNTTTSFTYDALGNIESKTENGVTTDYLYGTASGWNKLLTGVQGS